MLEASHWLLSDGDKVFTADAEGLSHRCLDLVFLAKGVAKTVCKVSHIIEEDLFAVYTSFLLVCHELTITTENLFFCLFFLRARLKVGFQSR